MTDMIKQVKLLEAKIKKASDQFADELKYQRDFKELENFSNTILECSKEIVNIYLYTDAYPLEENDCRTKDVFRKRAIEIQGQLTKAFEHVSRLDLVEYVKVVKRMIHQLSHLIQLTDKYIELGELPEQKERPKAVNKRYKIEEQFDEWKEWVKTYRQDMAYYEPLMPYVEDTERQTRLANLVKKLKKAQKEKAHG